RLSVLLTSSDQQTPLFYASKTGLRSCFFISLRENVRLSKTGGRLVSRTDFMISAGIRKNSPTGNIHPDGLTKTFVKARKASGV
ncbi:hypothetical protein MJM95_30805, partial [Salmonella enterica subsp. enterica serovar Anatum]|nr:hypothetical protein [Salmonella enterica subsp. enterica serovar Anatum]